MLLHSRPVGPRHRPLGQRTATLWGSGKVANRWKPFPCAVATSANGRAPHCDTRRLKEHCPIVLLQSRPVGPHHRPLGQRTATRWGGWKVANRWKPFPCADCTERERRWRTATRAGSRSIAPSCCCTLALLDHVIGHLANEQRHDGAVGRSPTGGNRSHARLRQSRTAVAHCDTCRLKEHCPIVLLHSRPVGPRHRPLGQRTATRWGSRNFANRWKPSISRLRQSRTAVRRTATRAGSRSIAPSCCCTLALLDHVIGHLANELRHFGVVGRSPTVGNRSHALIARARTAVRRTATRAGSRSIAPSCCCSLALLDHIIGHLPNEQRHDGAVGRSPTVGNRSHLLIARVATRLCAALRHVQAQGALPHRAAALSPCLDHVIGHLANAQRHDGVVGRSPTVGNRSHALIAPSANGCAPHCDTCRLIEHCRIVLLHSRPVGPRHRPLGQRIATRWGSRKVANRWKPFPCAIATSANGGVALRHVQAQGALPHRAAALSPSWTTPAATWPTNCDTKGQ